VKPCSNPAGRYLVKKVPALEQAKKRVFSYAGSGCAFVEPEVSIRKIMFLSILDWDRLVEPNFEAGRSAKR